MLPIVSYSILVFYCLLIPFVVGCAGDACVGKTALTQVFNSSGTVYPKNYLMVRLLSLVSLTVTATITVAAIAAVEVTVTVWRTATAERQLRATLSLFCYAFH